jgi:hypothetical protein
MVEAVERMRQAIGETAGMAADMGERRGVEPNDRNGSEGDKRGGSSGDPAEHGVPHGRTCGDMRFSNLLLTAVAFQSTSMTTFPSSILVG